MIKYYRFVYQRRSWKNPLIGGCALEAPFVQWAFDILPQGYIITEVRQAEEEEFKTLHDFSKTFDFELKE